MCLNKDTGIQKSNIFKPDSQQHTHYVTNDGATGNEVHTDDEIYAIYTISHKRTKPLRPPSWIPYIDCYEKELNGNGKRAKLKRLMKLKNTLSSSKLLVHYDPGKELIMACAASLYGLGVVLSHRMHDGSERPVAYASKMLSPAERNYSHLQKEALAVVYGVKKFHQYCYGRHFEIKSDHKPLEGIFGEHKPIPSLAAARLQRWALILSAYDYELKYRKGAEMSNADGLSRLPLCTDQAFEEDEDSINVFLTELERSPVDCDEVRLHSRRDPVISKVIDCISRNRRHEVNTPESSAFSTRIDELSVDNGCLLWGCRVVVPNVL